jgi:hypothetical protein
MVQDRQGQRLQDHRLRERGLHHQDRGAGEVAVALGVAPDVPGEPVRLQVPEGGGVDHPGVPQELQLTGPEPEPLQRVKQPPGARDHPVPPSVGQVPREHLEHRLPLRRAAAQRSGQHGQLVVIGEQGCARARRLAPRAWIRHEWKTTDSGGPAPGQGGQLACLATEPAWMGETGEGPRR